MEEDSPFEEEVVLFELGSSARVPKPMPVALEDLCRLTKFTRQEIRVMYRGFKTVIFLCVWTRLVNFVYYWVVNNACRNVQKVLCMKTVLKTFMPSFFHMEVSVLM